MSGYPHAPSRKGGTVPSVMGVTHKRSKPPTGIANGTVDADSKAANVAQEKFDEYGAELEPDARVWKTYVKEADKFDGEQVEGWNRSLDVTLIFAALFTAICTAFVIESSKSLKEDPTETTARRLDQISSILLVMAGVSDPSQLNSTEIIAPITPEPFSPRAVDLCVNVLWFFSLILSAAVSLISMLAKEWCYQFMSGRIGDPWSQTKKRQRRWEGIEKWKMEKVIIFLPSLIHLSFLSFAVGLCIYLGDLSLGVAIPAAFVTLASMLIYVLSTFLPLLGLFDAECPYSTSISRFVQRLRENNKSANQDPEENDSIPIRALAWLIKTNEDPKSTDIALQAIAGADPDNADRELLQKCRADTMISRRLIALDSYTNNYEQISDLYARAQDFFHPATTTPMEQTKIDTSPKRASNNLIENLANTSTGVTVIPAEKVNPKLDKPPWKSSGGVPQKNLHRGLQKQIRSLRNIINKQITVHITSKHGFLSTPEKIQALRVGSTAASHCLRSLQKGIQTQTEELFDSAINLLERYRKREAHLNHQEIEFLMIGIAMLLSSLLVECPMRIGAQYVTTLLRTTERVQRGQKQLRSEYLGLPLIAYALSRYDYPVWIQPPPLSSLSRAERSIEVIAYYVSHRTELRNATPNMINLALLELLSDPKGYELEDGDIVVIGEAFDPIVDGSDETRIHTFPRGPIPDTFSRTMKSIATMVSRNHDGLFSGDGTPIAYLTVLNRIRMDESASDALVGQVYAFVIECVFFLSPRIASPEAFGWNTALDVMQRFSDHICRTDDHVLDLAQSLGRKETLAPTTLKMAVTTELSDNDFVMKLFATGLAWFLIELAIKSKTANSNHKDWQACLGHFIDDESLWDFPDLVTHGLEKHRDTFAEQYRTMWDSDKTRRHEYFETLYKSLPPVGAREASSQPANA